MKTEKKEFYQDPTLTKLTARKERLQLEAEVALGLLENKLSYTFRKTKVNLVTDLALPTLVNGLFQPARNPSPVSDIHSAARPVDWPVEIQQTIEDYSSKRRDKWTAFVPLLLKVGINYYRQQQTHASHEEAAAYVPQSPADR